MGSKPWPGRVAVRPDQSATSPQPNQILRVVHVLRNRSGKFGFSFKTIQLKDRQTLTLVKTVKSDCQIADGILQPLDQILMINEVNISSLEEDDIYKELQRVKTDCVTLVVTSPASAKLGQLMSPAQPRHPLPYDEHCGTELTGCGSMPSRHSSQTYGSMADSQHSSHNGCQQPLIHLPQQVPDPVTYFPHPQEDGHGDLTRSLPVATDDIAVRVEPTYSLPLTATAPQHTPPLGPSTYNHPRSVSGGSGGPWHLQSSASVDSTSDGGSRGPGSRLLDTPRCRNPCCETENCTWHSKILSAPHRVVWDPSPITVHLEKNGFDSFQFSYKVKLHEKGEVFSVVTRVKAGGPADGALHVGDNILSCNSTPLESANKAYHYDFEKFNSLKLVIQRPASILARGGLPRDKQQPRLPINPPPQCPTRSPSTPTSSIPSRSPATPTSPCSCSPQARSAFSLQSPAGEDHRLWKFSTKKRVPSRDSAFDSPTSPLTPESSSLTTPLLPAKPASPPVVLPLVNYPLGMGGEPCRHLPKGRLIVCGSKAVEITQRLLSGVPGFDPFRSCPVSFHKLCLCRHGDGSVQFHEWHQDTASLLRGYATWGLQQTTCCQVHGEGSSVPILNTEAYVIADENFLQQACHRLCTDKCVYLVTFDARRLLSSSTLELASLARLLHTIRASAGKEAVIKMYGVLRNDLSAGDSVVGEDEVRTLFYTSLGHQLEVYSVQIPEVISLQEPLSGNLSQLAKINRVLLEEMVTLTTRCRVSPASLLLLELLPGEGGVFGVHRRAALASVLQARHPQLSEAACSQAVIDLVQCGELVPLPPLHEGIGSQEGGEDLVWGPGFLHHLSLLLLESPSQSPRSTTIMKLAFRLAATATTTTFDLLDLLEGMTTNPRQAVSLLHRAGVIFPLSRDTLGASSGGEYLIPYFLVEGGAEKGAGGGRPELELYVAARSRLSWHLLHQLVSALATHPGSSALRCPALGVCSLTLQGLELCLTLQLAEGRIRITVSRASGAAAKEAKVLALLQGLFHQVMPTQVTYDLGPACPIPCCRQPYLHVLDLHRTPVYCGHTRVDTHPSIKAWLATENPTKPTPEDVMSWSILKLKFSVLQALSRHLSIENESVPDWRTLADHVGMTMRDVMLISSLKQGLPAENLLKEWGSSEQGTIGHLHSALTEMGRSDALSILQEFIDSQSGGT